MRRAYVGSTVSLDEALVHATKWAGDGHKCVIGPSTSAFEASPWIESSGLALGTATHRHSRFTASPGGTVIAWCLMLDEVLEIEGNDRVSGVVAVRPTRAFATWATAHDVVHLAGDELPRVPEAPRAIKVLVEGLTDSTIRSQGLIDPRERAEAVQALTFYRSFGHVLRPQELIVEALRHGWPRGSSLALAKIATDLNAGKRLRFDHRIRHEVLARWAES